MLSIIVLQIIPKLNSSVFLSHSVCGSVMSVQHCWVVWLWVFHKATVILRLSWEGSTSWLILVALGPIQFFWPVGNRPQFLMKWPLVVSFGSWPHGPLHIASYYLAACFLRVRKWEESASKKEVTVFHNLGMEVKSHHFSLIIRRKMRFSPHKGVNTSR